MKKIMIIGWIAITAAQAQPKEEILFFRSNTEGSKGELFLMQPDGSRQRQVGQSGNRPDHYPNWSPDGQQITFESYRRGGWRIWIMDKNGENARRLNEEGYGTQHYEFDPTFSSDGSRVIYFRHEGPHPDLFSVDVDNGRINPLTTTPEVAEFSPDVSIRNELIFVAANDSFHDLFKIELKSGRRIRLTNDSHREMAPVWSPDGSTIVYYTETSGSFELHLMNADGSNPKRLISNETLRELNIKKGRFLDMNEGWNSCLRYRASFSGDGQWIAFSAETSQGREIFVASIDGKRIQRLTNNQVHDGFPMFSPR